MGARSSGGQSNGLLRRNSTANRKPSQTVVPRNHPYFRPQNRNTSSASPVVHHGFPAQGAPKTAPSPAGSDLCARPGCGHPADWHRHDDADDTPPTDPDCPFRCLGYDVERDGYPSGGRACDCPDFLEGRDA